MPRGVANVAGLHAAPKHASMHLGVTLPDLGQSARVGSSMPALP